MAKKDKDKNENKSSHEEDENFGLPDFEGEEETNEPSAEEAKETPKEEPAEEKEETTFDTSETSEAASQTEVSEEPIKEEAGWGEEEAKPAASYTPPKQKSSAAPLIITLVVILIAALAAVYFLLIRPAEQAKKKKEVAKKEQPAPDTTTYVTNKPEKVEKEPAPQKPAVGEINTLKQRTGRSYVVVGSFFDEDMAHDYAEKITKDGMNAYIIPPFGKSRFTRVAVEELSSFGEASTRAKELSGAYKEQPWPLKY